MTERTLREKISALIAEDHLQLLSDFDVDGDIYRQDPECVESAYMMADAILALLDAPERPAIADAPGSDRPGPDAVTEAPRVEDLAMMIRMLVRHVPEGKQIKAKAVDYLRRHGLQGSPFRSEEPRT